MSVDKFFVIGRETPDGNVQFRQTYFDGVTPATHWGDLQFADRYHMIKDAKVEATDSTRQCESDEIVAVWRVEVTATKETT